MPVYLNSKMFEQVFQKFPKTSMFFITVLWSAPYFPYVKNYFVPPLTYQDGEKAGHKRAREELQQQAINASKKTKQYISDDFHKMKSGEPVDSQYMNEKLSIYLSPNYNLNLLGDSYIIKAPLLRSSWNNVWLLRSEDVVDMEKEIEKMMDEKLVCKVDDLGLEKRKIRQSIGEVVSEKSFKLYVDSKL